MRRVILPPGLLFINETIKNYAASYVAGECDYYDAVGLALGDINEYIESDEFQKEVKNYFDNFADVKEGIEIK